DAFGAAGPDGIPCTVTLGTVTTGAVGSDLQATVTGAPPNLTLNLTVPRGVKGLKGEAGGPGPIRGASDYADTMTADGAIPVWDASIQKWRPRPYPGLRGPWSIIESRAWDGGNGFAPSQTNVSASQITVAQLSIPSQDCDWRPMITGGVYVQNWEGASSFKSRIDAEVHIGSVDGQIVALGPGFPASTNVYARFQEYFGTRITPDSAIGVIPAGQPVVFYVVVRRAVSPNNVNYNYSQAGAQIICWARPVGLPAAP
ncbi:hypothetical protein ACW9HQ_37870, partial [Nocardia gipuzkoensis]